MATQLQYDCPHCFARTAGFRIAYQWLNREKASHASLLAICGICNAGIVIESADNQSTSHYNLAQHSVDYPGSRFVLIRAYPNYSAASPENIPPNVARFYEQGMDNLQHSRWDAAGAMFRKSLDVGTKALAPQHNSETLFKRINAMVASGQLTAAMGDWSHEIRLDGNDAVHDDEPETADDAHAMQRFAEALLTYAFTLPKMVEKNRAKRVPENEPGETT